MKLRRHPALSVSALGSIRESTESYNVDDAVGDFALEIDTIAENSIEIGAMITELNGKAVTGELQTQFESESVSLSVVSGAVADVHSHSSSFYRLLSPSDIQQTTRNTYMTASGRMMAKSAQRLLRCLLQKEVR
ncbi:hypothetical protein C3B51_14360 [Pseudoalteromonas rubra]|uniref:Uncharacterized protein n=1 Tax=Pseudoalteromonas rubra TaxID=43658 RepID=A0A4V2E2F8_9GAMM|nr:hypothetical protein [Pseudoalteromonas rubra]RZM78358.1 hypothetical protein C3B51_14360 [Pseudoalteromonas rubra]